jgi:hypothetical protein
MYRWVINKIKLYALIDAEAGMLHFEKTKVGTDVPAASFPTGQYRMPADLGSYKQSFSLHEDSHD